MQKVSIFVLGVLLGAAIACAGVLGSDRDRINKLTEQLATARTDNSRLEESIRIRQSYLDSAGTLVRSSQDSVTKIRALIKLIKEAESATGSSGDN